MSIISVHSNWSNMHFLVIILLSYDLFSVDTVPSFQPSLCRFYSASPREPFAQSAEAVEYTDAPCQRSNTPTNEWPRYDTKQSDCEVLAILEL